MNVNKVELKITAVKEAQYPIDEMPEIAFVGRSNVGKSSLINSLINRKSLARTSSQPGKTRVINFYDVEQKVCFVDLPGYGYAKVSKTEKEKWGEMIEQYLYTRKQLTCIVMLVDVRHDPSYEDIQMYNWISRFNHKRIVVCTKADKLSKAQVNKNIVQIKKILGVAKDDNVIAFSSETKQGKDEVWDILDSLI